MKDWNVEELLYLYYCNMRHFEGLIQNWKDEDCYDDRKGHNIVESLRAANFIRDEIVRRCER